MGTEAGSRRGDGALALSERTSRRSRLGSGRTGGRAEAPGLNLERQGRAH